MTTITPANYLSVYPTLPKEILKGQIPKRHEHFVRNATDLDKMLKDSVSMKSLMLSQIIDIEEKLKTQSQAIKGYDFIWEVSHNGGGDIKTFLDFELFKGLKKLDDSSTTVKNLHTYSATKLALDKLKKMYANNSYGDKHRLSSKDLISFSEIKAIKAEQKQEPKAESQAIKPKAEAKVLPLLKPGAGILERVVRVQSVEVKHLKRFLDLVQYSTKLNVIDAQGSLQADNAKGLFSIKTSESGKELATINGIYTALLSNNNKGRYQVTASKEFIQKIALYAQAEKIDPCIDVLLKYLKLEGKEPHKKEVEKLLAEISKIENNKSQYWDEAKRIEKLLTNWSYGEALKNVQVGLQGTYILEGLGNTSLGCVPCITPAVGKLPDVMEAKDVSKINYETIDLGTTKFSDLFGKAQKNAAIMIWGEPGAGKSTLSMQLALWLGNHGTKTLYISDEEYGSMTLGERMERLGGAAPNLFFGRNIAQINTSYEVVMMDSTNSMKLPFGVYRELRERFPKTCFILIMQATKGGQFKGNKLWEHEVDIVVQVKRENQVSSQAETTKNRFQPLSSVEVF